MAVTVPRCGPEAINWALSDEYHDTPGGHVRIYRRSTLERRLGSAGLEPTGSPPRPRAALALLVAALPGRAVQRLAPGGRGLPQGAGLGHRQGAVRDARRRPGAQPAHRQEPGALPDQARRRASAGLPDARPNVPRGVPGRRGPTTRPRGRRHDDRGDPLRQSRCPRCRASSRASDVLATGHAIAAVQRHDGMIPWFDGGHCDPWNHVEAAMALTVCGLVDEAVDAYRWLAGRQLPDGSWFNYYQGDARQGPPARHQRVRLPGGRRLAPPPDHRRRRVPGRALADHRAGHRLHPALAAARRLGPVVARLGRPAGGATRCSPARRRSTTPCAARWRSPSAWPRTARTGSWRPGGSATPWPTTPARSRPRSSSPWTGTTRCCRARSRARRAGAASPRAGRPSSWRASACAASRRATGSPRPRRRSAC